MIDLTEYLIPEHIFFNVNVKDKQSLIKYMVKKVTEVQDVKNASILLKKIQEREDLESTGIGKGFAIPHCHLKNFSGVQIFMAILSEPIEFQSIDNSLVRIVFMIISGDENNEQYLKILSSLIYLIKQNDVREKLFNANTPDSVTEILASIKKDEQLPYGELLKSLIELEKIDYEIETYNQESALDAENFVDASVINAQAIKRREEIENKIDRRVYGIYKNLKKRYGFGIIVKLKGNVCGGCNLKVPVHIIREIRRGMQILQCENCARILYLPSIIKQNEPETH